MIFPSWVVFAALSITFFLKSVQSNKKETDDLDDEDVEIGKRKGNGKNKIDTKNLDKCFITKEHCTIKFSESLA